MSDKCQQLARVVASCDQRPSDKHTDLFDVIQKKTALQLMLLLNVQYPVICTGDVRNRPISKCIHKKYAY